MCRDASLSTRIRILSGQLEVDKHWYRFMMFGRLSYDLTLTRDFFEQRLKQRFPQADAALLYDTLQASSQIIPQVNRFFFRINDSMFSPEGCISRGGFLTVDDSFFKYPPLGGFGNSVGSGVRGSGAGRQAV